MHPEILTEILLLLGLSVIAVGVFRKIHLPPVFGYLLVGIVASPYAFGWLPAHNDTVSLLAEIGVVFLLFMIGLEFSLAQFWGLRRAVLGLGGIQVLVSTLVGMSLAMWAGLPWEGALVLGGAASLSSTAIVVKQLNEQLEMSQPHGRLALAVLLFQDIAVVPFLVVIPILGGAGEQSLLIPLLLALGKGVVAVAAMLALGHWGLRPVFHWVAMSRSTELFTLTALLVSLAAAWLTHHLGLSLALGAFLAGMMLSETEFKHQIESDVRPFRDILMGLFFITVGTQLNLTVLPDIWFEVLWITFAIVVGKALLVLLAAQGLGYPVNISARTGLVLGNGGEFGFALITLALSHSLLSSEQTQSVLTAIVFSMLLSPLLVRYNGELVKKLHGEALADESELDTLQEVCSELQQHVIFCGFGRIGQNLGGVLRSQAIPYVALDMNPSLVKEARDAGESVFYADCTDRVVLHGAGLDHARLLVITIDNHHAASRIIREVREEAPELRIIVRTRDDLHMEELFQLGATDVLAETLEASMMMARDLLEALDVPESDIHAIVASHRDDHFHALRRYFHGDCIESVEESADPHHLHTVSLCEGHDAVGKALEDVDFGDVQVDVVYLTREGVRGDEPSGTVVLAPGDALVLEGSSEALEHAENVLQAGRVA